MKRITSVGEKKDSGLDLDLDLDLLKENLRKIEHSILEAGRGIDDLENQLTDPPWSVGVKHLKDDLKSADQTLLKLWKKLGEDFGISGMGDAKVV